jgi:hypothetical protein
MQYERKWFWPNGMGCGSFVRLQRETTRHLCLDNPYEGHDSNMSEELPPWSTFSVHKSTKVCWSVLKPTFLARSQNCESEYQLHHVCPCVRTGQLGFHWTDFHKLLYLKIFRKFIKKIRVPLKSVKENAHFTWSPLYIFDRISLNSSWNDKFFKQKL